MKTSHFIASVTILLTFSLAALNIRGQGTATDTVRADTLWKTGGIISLNLSQLALNNWAAGGENSVSGNGLLQLSVDYNDGTMTWDNDLVLGYGLIKQGEGLARKSDDRVDLSSKFGYKAGGNWYYSALLSFRTQFTEGYDRPGDEDRTRISNWMAPGYLNISAGMDYKPGEHFTLLIAPVTGKMTFVLDDELSAAGTFGLEPGERVRGEFGGFIKAGFKKEIMKNVLLNTTLDLFSNYLENPQYIDVNWDLLLSMKVNEYISATLQTQLIYDRDILFAGENGGEGEPRVQFKELFGIGLTYNF